MRIKTNIMRIIIACMLTLGGFVVLSIGAGMNANDTSIRGEINSYILPFLYIVILSIVLKNTILSNNAKYFSMKDKKYGLIKTIVVGLLAMIIPLSITIIGGIFPLLDKKPLDNYMIIIAELILLNISVGIFEEGLFRVIILRIFMRDDNKRSFFIGFVVSSLLFGLLHFGNLTLAIHRPIAITSQVIYASLLGMLFAGLYIRYKSVIGIIFLHGLVDFLSSIKRAYDSSLLSVDANLPDISILEGIMIVAILIPSAVVGIILLSKSVKKIK